MPNIQFKQSREILKAAKKYEGDDRRNLEDIAILISAKKFNAAKFEADRLDTMLREECYELAPDEIPDDLNPEFIFSLTCNELLSKIVRGEIDPKELAWQELRKRGMDADGQWVGFGEGKCKQPFRTKVFY